jgi:Domain of unknown function (DUF929)
MAEIAADQLRLQTHSSRSGVRARDRIAGERAARRRAQARRRFLVSTAAVGAVLAIVVGLVAVKLTAGSAAASETLAPERVERQVSTVPVAALARVHGGGALTRLKVAKAPGPILRIGGKPAIVFVSEESCPFCAAERWPLAVALSHFGTWSHVGAPRSSAIDVFRKTATLSFRSAGSRSRALTLRTTELADDRARPLQRLTTLDNTLMRAYDVPPYVNNADQSGAVPFLDIGNRYILATAASPSASGAGKARLCRRAEGRRRASSQRLAGQGLCRHSRARRRTSPGRSAGSSTAGPCREATAGRGR